MPAWSIDKKHPKDSKQPIRVYHEEMFTLGASCWKEPPLVLVSPKSTVMPPPSSDTDSLTSRTMATSPKSTGLKYPTLICSSAEALASLSQSLENGPAFQEHQDYSWNTSVVSKRKSLNILSGRMLKAYCRVVREQTSPIFSIRFPKLGIHSLGKFSTPSTSEFRKTGSACSLSDILEPNPPEKYFLSPTMTEFILQPLRLKKRYTTLLKPRPQDSTPHGGGNYAVEEITTGQDPAHRVYSPYGVHRTLASNGGG